jgi:hypothetical protein
LNAETTMRRTSSDWCAEFLRQLLENRNHLRSGHNV